MLPEVPQTNNATPATLPAIPALPVNAAIQAPAGQAGAEGMPQPVSLPAAQAENDMDQVERLVEQYRQDPYKFSAALGQFKNRYLAKKFNISADTAE